jgi:biotin synthase
MERWKRLGVDYLGVGLDAATPTLFRIAGKPYTWEKYVDFVGRAVAVYGRGRVYVHLIAGLGESPVELVGAMEKLYFIGARVALFRYTPIPGTARFPGVDVAEYRLLQIARALLDDGYSPWDYIALGRHGRLLLAQCPPVSPAKAFLTSGCPGCNRPFYNEGPRGPIYNYPNPQLLRRDARLTISQLWRVSTPEARRCLEDWLSQHFE